MDPLVRILISTALAILLSWTSNCSAQENNEKTVRLGIFQRTFELYPDLGGRVWGFSVIADVFELIGYEVQTFNIPVRRIPVSLANNEIDVGWGSEEGMEVVNDTFLRSNYPVSLVPFMVYYDHRNDWKPSWPPDDIFTSKAGTSTQSSRTLKEVYGLQINQTTSFDVNLKMVNMGRADYCIDHIGGFGSATSGLQKSDDEGFAFETLFHRGIYAWFQDTERGRQLREDFDRGLIELLKQGRLGKSYCHKIDCPVEQEQVTAVMEMVNKENPGLNLPAQPVK